MIRFHRHFAAVSVNLIFVTSILAQGQAVQPGQAPATPPPPATKIEGFKPAAGSVLTIGFDELGSVGGVAVETRQMSDTKGATVRGLVVEVTESEHRQQRSFVDADEIPELLKGFDALLEVKTNPTKFKSFEVRYSTRGELQLTAFNVRNGAVLYAVQAGRTLKAQRVGLSASDMQQLRALFETASFKLATLGPK